MPGAVGRRFGPDDLDRELAEAAPDGWRLGHADAHLLDARQAQHLRRDRLRHRLQQPVLLLLDHLAHQLVDADVVDGLGNVAETATSNIFLAKDGVVKTPIPNGTFLNGITRQRTIGLLRAAARERARRRWLTTGLGLLAAACAIALIVIVVPPGSGPKTAPRAMTALVATPVDATVALRPRSWVPRST